MQPLQHGQNFHFRPSDPQAGSGSGCGGCLFVIVLIGLNVLVVCLPGIFATKFNEFLWLNPNPWLVAYAVLKRYGEEAIGWAGVAFLIMIPLSTFMLYWLSMIAVLAIRGLPIL